MKIAVEDKTIVRTFVKFEDFEYELTHLYEIMNELADSDLMLQDDELRDKLVKLGIASKSVFNVRAITRGKMFSPFLKQIKKLYEKKFPVEQESEA